MVIFFNNYFVKVSLRIDYSQFLSCADLESFAREGPFLTTFFVVFMREERIQMMAHQPNVSLVTFRWQAYVGQALNSDLVAL